MPFFDLSISPRAHGEDQDDLEPGELPVEPDQGPTLPAIPADPESERVTEPEI